MVARGFDVVDLDLTEQQHLVAAARLNGRKVQCTIDTGFTYSAVDQSRARQLPPVDPTHTAMAIPLAMLQNPTMKWVNMGHMELGGRRFEDLPAQSIQWRNGNRRDWLTRLVEGRQMFDSDVVLGADFLRHYHAVIDYGKKPALYLREQRLEEAESLGLAASLTNSGFAAVALYHLDSLGWVVPARFDGTRVPLLLDTGGTYTILDRRLVAQMGLPIESSPRQLKGVEGRKAEFGTTRFQLVELGPLAFEKPSIGVADLAAWNLNRTNATVFQPRGLIGADFFSKSRAIIDCAGMRLWCLVP